MHVLLDEQLPRQLVPYLVGHEARTVQEQGWAGLKNGELLKQARAAGFEIFLTGDQNLEFQQNLKNSDLFVVILVAASNALEDLLPIVPAALDAMSSPTLGQSLRVGSGSRLSDRLHDPQKLVQRRKTGSAIGRRRAPQVMSGVPNARQLEPNRQLAQAD